MAKGSGRLLSTVDTSVLAHSRLCYILYTAFVFETFSGKSFFPIASVIIIIIHIRGRTGGESKTRSCDLISSVQYFYGRLPIESNPQDINLLLMQSTDNALRAHSIRVTPRSIVSKRFGRDREYYNRKDITIKNNKKLNGWEKQRKRKREV